MIFRNKFLGGREALSAEQRSAFRNDGYLLVSGLIDGRVIQRACGRVLDRIPAGEAGSRHEFIRDSRVRACFTDGVCSTAQELAGPNVDVRPPRIVYTITVFPSESVWIWPSPHIDHALEKDGHKTFPPAFHVGCLIYLTDVLPHSGATVVWPGSHLELAALATRDPQRYEYLAALNRDISRAAVRDPVEITAAAGDVLFYDHLLAHEGSMNTGRQPRVALNHKW